MKNESEMIERMVGQGFVVAEEAARITGRNGGGNIHPLMMKCGVRCVRLGDEDNGRVRVLYYKNDLSKVPVISKDLPLEVKRLPGGNLNGGVLSHRIKMLEERIESLEKFRQEFT